MQRYVVGLCARFINGDSEFMAGAAAAAADPLDDKRVDELAQRAAKAALEAFVRGLSGLDAATLRRRGVAYRRAYKRAAAQSQSGLVRVLGAAAATMLASPEAGHEHWTGDSAVDTLWESARERAQRAVSERPINVQLARALGIGADGGDSNRSSSSNSSSNLFRVAAMFPEGQRPARGAAVAQQLAMRLFASALDRLEASARAALAAALPAAAAVAHTYEAALGRLVYEQRLAEHAVAVAELGPVDDTTEGVPNPPVAAGAPAAPAALTPDDRAAVLALRAAWVRAVGVQATRARLQEFTAHLGRLKLLRTGGAAVPPALKAPTARAAIVAAAAAAIRPSGDIAI
jgi:hypothetical protein